MCVRWHNISSVKSIESQYAILHVGVFESGIFWGFKNMVGLVSWIKILDPLCIEYDERVFAPNYQTKKGSSRVKVILAHFMINVNHYQTHSDMNRYGNDVYRGYIWDCYYKVSTQNPAVSRNVHRQCGPVFSQVLTWFLFGTWLITVFLTRVQLVNFDLRI